MKRKYDEQFVTKARQDYVPVFEYARKRDKEYTIDWKRLRHCSAKVGTISYQDEQYDVLKSYDTIVAIYDVQQNTLIEYGHYSSTTYQHCSKFRTDMYLKHHAGDERYKAYQVEQINLELVDWF